MTFWKFVHHGSIHDGCWHAVADFTCRDLCDRAAAPARQAGLYTSMGLQTISDGIGMVLGQAVLISLYQPFL